MTKGYRKLKIELNHKEGRYLLFGNKSTKKSQMYSGTSSTRETRITSTKTVITYIYSFS